MDHSRFAATDLRSDPLATNRVIPPCPGDCNFDGIVRVEEIILGVRIALGLSPFSECSGLDHDGDLRIGIDELMKGVNTVVFGCGDQRCGIDETICDFDRYCEFALDTCGDPNREGMCLLRPTACPEIFQPVCGCDGVTYSNDCERMHAGASLANLGLCPGSMSCGGLVLPQPGRCSEDEHCELPPGMCGFGDSPGFCEPRPTACPEIFQPVCGCDGVTYSNDCERKRARATRDHFASCDSTPCGGFTGRPCPEGDRCELPAGTCDIADLGGLCEPNPTACLAIVDPVCGCDGFTYSNDCERKRASVALNHIGPC